MPQLKAFVVRDPDEGNCEIVFAEKNVVARREGALELNCTFEEVESCTREPRFDQYAPGPVPLSAMLAAGWWHTCSGCSCEFDAEGIRGQDEGDEDEQAREYEPVSDGAHNHYCTSACMMASWAERRANKARLHAAIEECVTRWPEATKVDAYHTSSDFSVYDTCSFLLPGLQHRVTWTRGGTVVSVTLVDVDAFKARYSPA